MHLRVSDGICDPVTKSLHRPFTLSVMLDEATFRKESDGALESLKQALIRAEEDGGFEAEEKNGVLNVLFEDDAHAKFVFTPNTPVRQIWISAQSTSFKLEWDENRNVFVLPKTGEDLRALTERLLREQLGDDSLSLS
jgi:iron donor protein CyaY